MITRSSSYLAVFIAAVLVNSAFCDPAKAPKSGKYWVFIGTYTSKAPKDGSQGIYRCELDVKSGELSNLSLAAELVNPSFLAISPNGKCLYAVEETTDAGQEKNEGKIHAFAINATTGELTKLNQMTTGGGGPCYVSVNRTSRFALVANYNGGSSAMFRLKDDGSLEKLSDFRQHEGKSVHKDRQQAPHPHCALFFTENSFEYAFVVDLGLDKVFAYSLLDPKGTLQPTSKPFIKLPDGSGPRHIAFLPESDNSFMRLAFVCGELNSTLYTLEYRSGELGTFNANGLMEPPPPRKGVESTLPEDVPAEVRRKNAPAEVLIHPDRKHVLVSNRAHDSLAVFKTDHYDRTPVAYITGDRLRTIRTPRCFNIDPTGKWVLIGSQDGGVVSVAEWNKNNANLTDKSVNVDKPVCIQFLEKQ